MSGSTAVRPALLLGLALCAGLVAWLLHPEPTTPTQGTPNIHQRDGYVGSTSCQTCHPGAYDSWSHSFHSSMTRPASALVDGSTSQVPSFPVRLELDGLSYALDRVGDRIEFRGPDLDDVGRTLANIRVTSHASFDWKRSRVEAAWNNAQTVTRPLSLITGSHHYIALWVDSGKSRPLRQFPFVYFLDDKKWIPRREAFLQPPDALDHVARFNANCIQCHTVAGRPGQSEGTDRITGEFWERYDSETADLGIACEACHGPGAQHVSNYQNPFSRFEAQHAAPNEKSSADIFVPRQTKPDLSSAACGQCHSYFLPTDPNSWWERGFSSSFSAGEQLGDSRKIILAENVEPNVSDGNNTGISHLTAKVENLFWRDGSIMVGGREYNGLLQSPCFQTEQTSRKMTCVSCHSMHDGPAVDQLDPKFTGSNRNKMCTQCHEVASRHSRHAADSPGSVCINCHMPKTSYALLSGIRSHRITSPTRLPEDTRGDDPPSACTLCHVDRSADWLSTNIRAYFDKTPTGRSQGKGTQSSLDAERDQLGLPAELPFGIFRALGGNAAVRAIFLSALTSQDTLKTAGTSPFFALVEHLEEDRYAALIHMARRGSAQLSVQSVPKPLAAANWDVTEAQLERIRSTQDDTPVVISE